MSRKDLTRYNLMAVGAVVAPLVLVGLGSHVIGTGPGLTLALGENPDAGPAAVEAGLKARTLSPRQKLAMDRASALSGAAVSATPFRPEPVAEAPAEVESPAPVEVPKPVSKPEVAVKMIMRGSDGAARALIGGKMRSVGDEIGDGWTIDSIDAAARTVTFTSADGQTYTINLK